MKRILKMFFAVIMAISLFSGCGLTELISEYIGEQRSESEKEEKSESKEEEKSESEKEQKSEAEEEPTPESVKEPESPQTPADELSSLSSTERYELNIFLSNFAEAMYDPIGGYYYTEEEKISFVYTHALINSPSNLYYEDGYMGISQEYADATLRRFFGETISPVDLRDAKDWFFDGEYYLRPGADGEFYGYFSSAASLVENSDGTYDVTFNIYSDDREQEITDKSVYNLTSVAAAKSYDLVANGKATLKKKVHNGKNTYEVVYYDKY